MIATEAPLGKSTFQAKFEPNITYKIESNFLLNNEEIMQNSIFVEMLGSRRAVADFMQRLQGGIPDMFVHYNGAYYHPNHTCQLFVTILTSSGVVLPPSETIRILDNFVSKKSKILDITNYRSTFSLCDTYACGTRKCQQLREIKSEREFFRSFNKLWTMPRLHGSVKCDDEFLKIAQSEHLCGTQKCYK